jgi:SAM-dependent methyltransferase
MKVADITRGLALDKCGIWCSEEVVGEVSFPVDGHAAYRQVEDRSFWFRHRNACIRAAVAARPPGPNATILDVGGGNGYVASGLRAAGYEVAVLEPGRAGAENARHRGIDTVICASLDAARFEPGSVPAVGLFDVVEHVDDDLAFLRAIATALRPAGRLYVTVPAYPALWSAEDVSAGHFRRYTRRTIRDVTVEAGFEVEFVSHFFRWLPLPIALARTLPYLAGWPTGMDSASTLSRDHATRGGRLVKAVDLLLAAEVRHLTSGHPMRFGSSILMVARRRGARPGFSEARPLGGPSDETDDQVSGSGARSRGEVGGRAA